MIETVDETLYAGGHTIDVRRRRIALPGFEFYRWSRGDVLGWRVMDRELGEDVMVMVAVPLTMMVVSMSMILEEWSR